MVVSTLSSGAHIVTLSVTDSRGDGCMDQVVVGVEEPPWISWLGPLTDIRAGEPLRLQVLVDDPELGPSSVDVHFESDRDGALGQATVDNIGLGTLDLDSLTTGLHVITVTATDATGFSTSLDHDVVVVTHGAPSVSSVLISPKPVFSDEDLVCSYSGYSDPDGDPDESIVEWLLAGVVQATGPNLGRDLNKGEEWTCQVTPSDGWLQGAPVSDTVVVSNSPPSCSSVVISPRPVEAGDLDCAYGFADVDADMDQSTISWRIDGVYIADGASLGRICPWPSRDL